MILRGLLARFRAINARLNERWFGVKVNTYRYYLQQVERRLVPSGVVVDLGAGEVALARDLPRAGRSRVVALDQTPEPLANNHAPHKVVASAAALPFREASVNLITASCFFEHVETPATVTAECYRVLVPGGALVFYTPHRRSYVALVARAVPSLAFHRWIRTLQAGHPAEKVEVCQTHYRMNTMADLERVKGAFSTATLDTYIGAPCYTTFLPPPIHLLFVFVHQIVLAVPWLRRTVGETLIGCWVKA